MLPDEVGGSIPPQAAKINKIMEKNIYICKEYIKSKYDNFCSNCNSNKTYCDYSRTNTN